MVAYLCNEILLNKIKELLMPTQHGWIHNYDAALKHLDRERGKTHGLHSHEILGNKLIYVTESKSVVAWGLQGRTAYPSKLKVK